MATEATQSEEGSSVAATIEADWLGACRRAVAAQRCIFDEVRGVGARTSYEGIGVGGDHTLVIDRRCEDAIFAELTELAEAGASFVAISEERGEVTFGEGGEVRVVIDPIDGSLNARRTLPSHSFSLAVTSGPSMADAEFGFVHDFGADDEMTATRGGGARLNREPIEALEDEKGLELVGIESAKPAYLAPALPEMDSVYRLRVIGSIAIAASYVGTGRLDGMFSLRPCRSVDAAAAQLILREAGGHVAFGDTPLGETGLGLDERYPIAAAVSRDGLATLLRAQRASTDAR